MANAARGLTGLLCCCALLLAVPDRARADERCKKLTAGNPDFTGSQTLAKPLGQVSVSERRCDARQRLDLTDTLPAIDVGTDPESYRGRLAPGQFAAVRHDLEQATSVVAAGGYGQIGGTASLAVERSPAWLRDRLEDRFRNLSDERQQDLAELILDVDDPRLVDEVAFAVAALSLDTIENDEFEAEALLWNARAVYEADEHLQYVEIIDVGVADTDDDYYTTTRYHMLDADGQVVEYQIEPDDYYWYVAFPAFGSEPVTFIDPVTGDHAAVEDGGTFWRTYYWDQGEDPSRRAATHFGMEYPTLIDDDLVSGWGPSAMGVLLDFEIDPIPMIVDPVTGDPVLVVFSYPGTYYDANFVATTMPLELAYRNGDRALLENMLQLGNASAALPGHYDVAIIKDRDPWGEPTIELALEEMGFTSVEVFTSDRIGEITSGEVEYLKVIVPSGQPRALYEALADAREGLDEWLKRDNLGLMTAFEFHGAIDDTDPSDSWCDLDIPGGFTCSDPLTEQLDELVVAGYPTLMDVLSETDHVVQWSDEKQSWSGHRALDLQSSAIDLISYFSSANSQDRCSEIPSYYAGPDGEDHGMNLDQSLRSPHPHRTLYLHFGNCGEAQDVLSASSRAALLPASNVGGFVDDHVWNLTQVDGEWLTYTFYRSDGGASFGGDTNYSEDAWAAVIEWRGDGAVNNRTAMYNDSVTVHVNVTDEQGRPVDGALVYTASDDHGSDPDTLVYATLGWSDMLGQLSIDLGDSRNYYLGVTSDAGFWPGPEPNYVDQILTVSQSSTPGEEFQVDVVLDNGEPAAEWSFELAEAPTGEDMVRVRIEGETIMHSLDATNILYGMRFNEYFAGGYVDVVVVDETNFELLEQGEAFTALEYWDEVDVLSTTIDVPLDVDGALYVVASNQGRYGHSAFVSLSVSQEVTEEPPPDDEGGCQCASADPTIPWTPWALLLVAGVLALRRH